MTDDTTPLTPQSPDWGLLPLPARMPAPISTHPHLGDLYDRLAVHMYAVGYAQQCIAALMALGDGEKVPQINFVRQALTEEQIVAAAGRAVAVKIVAGEPITVDDWIEFARNIERAHGIGALRDASPAAVTAAALQHLH